MKAFGKMAKAANVSNRSWKEVGWYTILTAGLAGLSYLGVHLADVDMKTLGEWGPVIMTVAVPLISYAREKIRSLLKAGHPDDHLDFNMISKK
jgi:hypothetical protein